MLSGQWCTTVNSMSEWDWIGTNTQDCALGLFFLFWGEKWLSWLSLLDRGVVCGSCPWWMTIAILSLAFHLIQFPALATCSIFQFDTFTIILTILNLWTLPFLHCLLHVHSLPLLPSLVPLVRPLIFWRCKLINIRLPLRNFGLPIRRIRPKPFGGAPSLTRKNSVWTLEILKDTFEAIQFTEATKWVVQEVRQRKIRCSGRRVSC